MEFVFFFTLLAGITVLYAAVDATLDERRYESAMLRTLGAARGQIVKGLVAEFAVLGALAGLLAAVAASGLGAIVARSILSVSYAPQPLTWVLATAIGAIGVTVAGVLGTWPVLRQPPLTALREQG